MKSEKSCDGTVKFNFDNYSAVLIPISENKQTLCISSQVGCPMKCKFCLSGKVKFQKNLTLNELKEQITSAINYLKINDLKTKQNTKGKNKLSNYITSVVFMGMGEPLLNLNNVLKLCEYLNCEYGYSFAKITISTSGIIPKMKEIIDYKYPVQMALSLHSPRQNVRDMLMPNLKQYPIIELMKVCRDYNNKYKQKIMIEYLMINEVTDTDEDLEKLIDFNLEPYTNFNLIPMNKIKGINYSPSSSERVEYFKERLRTKGYKCFVRKKMGDDISAACGMLN